MNANLSDPLDKVSVSVRKAVTINRCREDDLRSVVGHISKEQRRSLNTWSSKQEQFLKTQKRLLPALKLPRSSLSSQQSSSRQSSGPSEASSRKVSKTQLPPIEDLSLRRSFSEPVKTQSSLDESLLQPDSSFITKRSSVEERKPVVYVQIPTDKESCVHTDADISPRPHALSVSSGQSSPRSPRRRLSPSPIPADMMTRQTNTLSEDRLNSPKRKLSPSPVPPDTHPRRKTSSRDAKNKGNLLSVHFATEEKIIEAKTAVSMPDLTKIGDNSRENSKLDDSNPKKTKISSWSKLKDSLGMFLLDPLGLNKRPRSIPDLTLALENMKECRYLRVPEKITAHNIENSKRCRCVTCSAVRTKTLEKNVQYTKLD